MADPKNKVQDFKEGIDTPGLVRGILYKPGNAPSEVFISPDYDSVSELLGGPVESVHLHACGLVALSNENSIAENLLLNRTLYPYGKKSGCEPQIAFGPVLILTEDWTDVPEDADLRGSVGSLRDTKEWARTRLSMAGEYASSSEDVPFRKAEILGRIYMRLSNASLPEAEKAVEKDVCSEVLKVYFTSTARCPKLVHEISELAVLMGEDFPGPELSPDEKKAFLRGCEKELISPIARLRKKKGLSQNELSDLLGVTQGMLSRWENGTAVPKADKLLKLAGILECPTDEFLDMFKE